MSLRSVILRLEAKDLHRSFSTQFFGACVYRIFNFGVKTHFLATLDPAVVCCSLIFPPRSLSEVGSELKASKYLTKQLLETFLCWFCEIKCWPLIRVMFVEDSSVKFYFDLFSFRGREAGFIIKGFGEVTRTMQALEGKWIV